MIAISLFLSLSLGFFSFFLPLIARSTEIVCPYSSSRSCKLLYGLKIASLPLLLLSFSPVVATTSTKLLTLCYFYKLLLKLYWSRVQIDDWVVAAAAAFASARWDESQGTKQLEEKKLSSPTVLLKTILFQKDYCQPKKGREIVEQSKILLALSNFVPNHKKRHAHQLILVIKAFIVINKNKQNWSFQSGKYKIHDKLR